MLYCEPQIYQSKGGGTMNQDVLKVKQQQVETITNDLAKSKAEMVKETDADAVITICPFCELNIRDGLDAIGCENIKVMHLLELLTKSYE